jgi:hypothetical protein
MYYHFNEPDLHRLIAEIDPLRWEYLDRVRHQSGKMTMSELWLIEKWISQNEYVYQRILGKVIYR